MARRTARSTVDVILGEASSPKEYHDIASVIANRMAATGMTAEQVVAEGKGRQFAAWGKNIPKGVDTAANRKAAQAALDRAVAGDVSTSATYYAMPSSTKNLPKAATKAGPVHSVKGGHQYFNGPYGAQQGVESFAGNLVGGAKQVVGGIKQVTRNVGGLLANYFGDNRPVVDRPRDITATNAFERAEGLKATGSKMSRVNGLVVHHTGPGVKTVKGLVNGLNSRGLSVQYTMDRQGKVTQLTPDPTSSAKHIRGADNNSGLTNDNAIGIEVMAADDSDITPAQRAAFPGFVKAMQEMNPGIGDNVFGHGEIQRSGRHAKQPTEGMTLANDYREAKGLPAWDEFSRSFGAPTPMTRDMLGQQEPQVAEDVTTSTPITPMGYSEKRPISAFDKLNATLAPTAKATQVPASKVASAPRSRPMPALSDAKTVPSLPASERVVGREVPGGLRAADFDARFNAPATALRPSSPPSPLQSSIAAGLLGESQVGLKAPGTSPMPGMVGYDSFAQQGMGSAPASFTNSTAQPIGPAERAQRVDSAERMQPISPAGTTNGTLFSNSVHEVAQRVGPEGTIVGKEIGGLLGTARTDPGLEMGDVAHSQSRFDATANGLPDPNGQSALARAGPMYGLENYGSFKPMDEPLDAGSKVAKNVVDHPVHEVAQAQAAAPNVTDDTGAYPPKPDVFNPGPTTGFFNYGTGLAARKAATGLLGGGLPGALFGGLGSLIGQNMPSGFNEAVPESSRFSVGSGLTGINAALSGPKGATATSRTQKGASVTSLGNGQSLRRSDRYGWTEVVGPDGSVVGIQYDHPQTKGLLGRMSNWAGSTFGGSNGLSPSASRAIRDKTDGGLY